MDECRYLNFYKLSKFNIWNQYNQQMEKNYNVIEELMNILSYVDSAKLCNVIHNLL